MRISINITPAQLAYFDSCARIRDIATGRLLSHMVEAIADDQLVLSILDDDSRAIREKGQHRYRAH
jgi:hypothetical protein